MNLLASNRRQSQSKVVASADETTIYIYDAIVQDDDTAAWWGGVSAQSLVPQIRGIKGGTINLRINSPGGDVFAAQAIAQAIRDTGAHVVAHIDGYAASAATVIATAADESNIASGAFFMIHNAWTFALGNSKELQETAALLEKVDLSMAAQYAQRSGKTADEMKSLMDAETWFSAEEAVEIGLVSRIAEGKKAQSEWNLNAYSNAPKIESPQMASDEHRDRQRQRIGMLSRIQIG